MNEHFIEDQPRPQSILSSGEMLRTDRLGHMCAYDDCSALSSVVLGGFVALSSKHYDSYTNYKLCPKLCVVLCCLIEWVKSMLNDFCTILICIGLYWLVASCIGYFALKWTTLDYVQLYSIIPFYCTVIFSLCYIILKLSNRVISCYT